MAVVSLNQTENSRNASNDYNRGALKRRDSKRFPLKGLRIDVNFNEKDRMMNIEHIKIGGPPKSLGDIKLVRHRNWSGSL